MIHVADNLNKILQIFFPKQKIYFSKKYFHISGNKINNPLGYIIPRFTRHLSSLPNRQIDWQLLEKLKSKLEACQSIIRLNHIGFCYKTESQQKEKEELLMLASNTKQHLYQEESNDSGLWLFMGNTGKWEDTLIEFIPVEKTNDKWADYWLPHMQIDIDTKLSAPQIQHIINLVYGDKIKPYLFDIKGTVYFARINLGIYNGINIFLDLATSARNVQYHRQNILKKITIDLN